MSVRDPYRYFRIEARELLDAIGAALMRLERGADLTLTQEILRHAHTLKGAARVVRQAEIGRLAHALEDLLAGGVAEAPSSVGEAFTLLERMRALLERLDAPQAEAGPPTPHPGEPVRSPKAAAARLDLGTADDLLERARRTAVGSVRSRAFASDAMAILRRASERLASVQRRVDLEALAATWTELDDDLDAIASLLRSMDAELDEQVREGAELEAAISEVRLVSMEALAQELEQLARASAEAVGKPVRVIVSGAETRIDAGVLAGLRAAMRHLVQNAIAHGIEPESGRIGAQKDPVGQVALRFEAHGHRVHAICADDGAGIDEAAVRRVLSERGAEVPAEIGRAELLDLVFTSGFSTAQRVDEIAGRGVGLDAVAAAVTELNGEVQLDSSAGRGTTVRVIVPISQVSTRALALDVGGRAIYVPLDNVAKVLRVEPGSVSVQADRERILLDGEAIPFMAASRLLAGASVESNGLAGTAVVLQAGRRRAAIGVAHVRGVRPIVTRVLPDRFEVAPVVAGAAISASGVPELVLATIPTIEAVARGLPQPRREQAKIRLPILVVDDSLTTRMLEKGILESAGYEVDLAVSAEQAIEMARQRRYGLFLVDVEMPGMDGFGLVAYMRDDPELASVPAILVTSRSSEDDARRGRASGARGYIVKSEFDQNRLLETIGSLVA